MNKKSYLKLFILYLSVVFVFGGCSGTGAMIDQDVEPIYPGRYYAFYGENFNNPDWTISDDSYIRIFYFHRVGYNEYEISFSGVLFWRNRYGQVFGESVPQRAILMTEVDYCVYETKLSSAPYVFIEIFDDESFDLYTERFMVSL